jgi:hypothetical protein
MQRQRAALDGALNLFILVGKNKILRTFSLLKLISSFQPFSNLQRVLFVMRLNG